MRLYFSKIIATICAQWDTFRITKGPTPRFYLTKLIFKYKNKLPKTKTSNKKYTNSQIRCQIISASVEVKQRGESACLL